MHIPDNTDLFNRYEAERQRELDKLPECSYCDEPIQSEECYEINDELVCPDCLDDNHKKRTEDYVE